MDYVSRTLIKYPHNLFVVLKKNGGIEVRFEVFYHLDLKDFAQVGNVTSNLCKIYSRIS